MNLEEIGGLSQYSTLVGQVSAAHSILQDISGQELRMADLAVRSGVTGDQRSTINQFQRRNGMRVKELRAAAIIGKRQNGGDRILVAHGGTEAGFHSPDGEQHTRRHAVGPFDLVEQRRVRLLQRTALGNDADPPRPLMKSSTEPLKAL